MAETHSVEDPSGAAIAVAAPGLLADKANQSFARLFVLAILAGALIAFGAIGALVAQADMGDGGAVQLLSGVAFSVGLIMVMIVGAELFTGNTMMTLSVITGHLGFGRMALAWMVAWLGNLFGALTIALLFAASGALTDGVGDAAIALADGKLAKSPTATFSSAILANMLVCLAVWMSMAALTLPAKILAVLGPITIFVAAGLEHSIANMSILPLGWLANSQGGMDLAAGVSNLVFSTLGNILGGSLVAVCLAFGHGALRGASR